MFNKNNDKVILTFHLSLTSKGSHFILHPLRKTAVRIPGPSCKANF